MKWAGIRAGGEFSQNLRDARQRPGRLCVRWIQQDVHLQIIAIPAPSNGQRLLPAFKCFHLDSGQIGWRRDRSMQPFIEVRSYQEGVLLTRPQAFAL